MANNHTYSPTSVSTPGSTIRDLMDESGIALKALAAEMKVSVKALNEILKGKSPVTREIATALESVFKTPAAFWLNREKQYREFITGQQSDENMKEGKAQAPRNNSKIKSPAIPAIAHHRL